MGRRRRARTPRPAGWARARPERRLQTCRRQSTGRSGRRRSRRDTRPDISPAPSSARDREHVRMPIRPRCSQRAVSGTAESVTRVIYACDREGEGKGRTQDSLSHGPACGPFERISCSVGIFPRVPYAAFGSLSMMRSMRAGAVASTACGTWAGIRVGAWSGNHRLSADRQLQRAFERHHQCIERRHVFARPHRHRRRTTSRCRRLFSSTRLAMPRSVECNQIGEAQRLARRNQFRLSTLLSSRENESTFVDHRPAADGTPPCGRLCCAAADQDRVRSRRGSIPPVTAPRSGTPAAARRTARKHEPLAGRQPHPA